MEFNAMSRPCGAQLDISGAIDLPSVDAAGGDCVLRVLAIEQNRHVPPGMIVQRAIVVTSKKLVKVDVEQAIARNDPPASQIIVAGFANYKVR
ncbi:hypothetical protein [Nitrobacter sp.]|uniref:hypothetical protein n=1 Tax=Nitrobacter sp. TaxID=29420 RepID=UPI003F653D9B